LRLLVLYTKSRGKDLLGAFGKIKKLGISALKETESDQQPNTLETGFGFLGVTVPKTPGKISRGFRAFRLQKLEDQKIAGCQLDGPDFGEPAGDPMALGGCGVFKICGWLLCSYCFSWFFVHGAFRSFRPLVIKTPVVRYPVMGHGVKSLPFNIYEHF